MSKSSTCQVRLVSSCSPWAMTFRRADGVETWICKNCLEDLLAEVYIKMLMFQNKDEGGIVKSANER